MSYANKIGTQLPSTSGQTGKFLTNNGTTLSWGTPTVGSTDWSNLTGTPPNISIFYDDIGIVTTTSIGSYGYMNPLTLSGNISQLTNDSGYITTASIPTNISFFNNDSGYLTTISGINISVLTNNSNFIDASGVLNLYFPQTLSPSQFYGLQDVYVGGENPNYMFNVVYIKSTDGKIYNADATVAGKFPAVAIITASGALNSNINVLKVGKINNSSWNWTVGSPIYLSTSGQMTQTPPSSTDNCIQILGYAISSATIYFNPTADYITHV